MNYNNQKPWLLKLVLFLAIISVLSVAVSAAWERGTVFTPTVKQAGLSPATVSASEGDTGTVLVVAYPQHPTKTEAAFNKFYSFTVEGSFSEGVEISSIALSPALVTKGWSTTENGVNAAARTFKVVANVPIGPNFIASTPTSLLELNVNARTRGERTIQLTKVDTKVAGQAGVTSFDHPSVITVTEAAAGACAAADWEAGAFSACSVTACGTDGTKTRTVTKKAGVDCTGETGKPAISEACVGTICSGAGETCTPAGCRAAVETKKDQLKREVTAAIDSATVPEGLDTPAKRTSFLSLISNLARTIRDLFR